MNSSVQQDVLVGGATYAAFISYARADAAIAARLQKRLETYSLPKSMRAAGQNKLRPIFRDRTELAAHNSLGGAIRSALKNSKCLIVLCSPEAKASKWVNDEIRLFRELHPGANIFAALVSGTPDTAFPKQLVEGGKEPLAASLEGGRSDEKFGTSQLIASLLGVSLDKILRRDTERRRRRLATISTLAFTFSSAMAALALFAMSAQKRAEINREEAEGLVEYMLSDLKAQLEPVGRLDVLDGLGDRVVEYYETHPLNAMTSERLARRARARHLLGQVALSMRDIEAATREVSAALKLTESLWHRHPDDEEVIFAHAQSLFWMGELDRRQSNPKAAREAWEGYLRLAETLYQKNPNKFNWVMERAWAELNLGALDGLSGAPHDATTRYKRAITLFERAEKIEPFNSSPKKEIANTLGWLADAALVEGTYDEVAQYRRRQYEILSKLQPQFGNDAVLTQDLVVPQRELLMLKFLKEGIVPDDKEWRAFRLQLEDLHIKNAENAFIFQELCYANMFPIAAAHATHKHSLSKSDISDYKIVCDDYVNKTGSFGPTDRFIVSYWQAPEDPRHYEALRDLDLKGPTETQKLYIWYFHLLTLSNLNLHEEARLLADSIVAQLQEDDRRQSPQQLLSEIAAFGILGDCQTSNARRNELVRRGYFAPNTSSFRVSCE